jgi:hypothetical protein
MSIHHASFVAAVVLSSAAAIAQPTFVPGTVSNEQFVGTMTTNFLFDSGTGVLRPGSVSTPVTMQVLLTAWSSRRGYDYYKARSDLNAAGLPLNPYFQQNSLDGDRPGSRSIRFPSLVVVPDGIADEGLHVGNDATAQPDQWRNLRLRVDFLGDALQLNQSFVTQDLFTLTSSSSGTALLSGVTNTFAFSTAGGLPMPMTPLAGGGGAGGSLYLESMTFTMTLVPSPGAAVILGLGGLMASRRRR